MNEFIEDKIEVYEYNKKYYEDKIKGLQQSDSMYLFHVDRLEDSKHWLDILYTARDAKADNPYSSC